MSKIEKTILSNLIHNEPFCRKVVPFLKNEYFQDHYERVIAEELLTFFNTYNRPASLDILAIQLSQRKLNSDQISGIEKYINDLTFKTDNEKWLLENVEKWCKQRAITNAILDAFDIIEGKDKVHTEEAGVIASPAGGTTKIKTVRGHVSFALFNITLILSGRVERLHVTCRRHPIPRPRRLSRRRLK